MSQDRVRVYLSHLSLFHVRISSSALDCPSAYAGETSRTFKSRVAEHLDDPNSAFGAHLMSTGHNYADSCKPLYSESNYNRRLALEHIEIIKHKQNPNLQIPLRFRT